MSMKKTGGAAFPREGYLTTNEDGTQSWVIDPQKGMDLRDWFAGQALAGLCANPDCHWNDHELARESYKYADAMLAERDRD